MVKIETIRAQNPKGKQDDMAHITCDEKATYRFDNIVEESGKHTFQTMIKSRANGYITVIFNDIPKTYTTGITWAQISCQGDLNISKCKYIELQFDPGEYWVYNTKLEVGNKTAWTLSPYDFADKVHDITEELASHSTRISQVSQTIDNVKKEVETKVTQSDINNSINGLKPDIEQANQGRNRWLVEIYDKSSLPEENREQITLDAFWGSGVKPTEVFNIDDTGLSDLSAYGSDYIGYARTFVQFTEKTDVNITFNVTDDGTFYLGGEQVGISANGQKSVSFQVGWNAVEVVWNVSSGTTTGGFNLVPTLSTNTKCSLMNCYYANLTSRDQSIIDKYSGMKITQDEITTRVSQTESDLTQKADGDDVQSLHEQVNESISDLESFKRTVSDNYITNDYKTTVESQFTQLTNSINARVTEGQMQAFWELNKNSWRLDFQENGAECGSILMDKTGITVGGDSTSGYTTKITSQEFSGSYNGNKVFWFNQEEMVTLRLRTERGIDMQTIKIVPIKQNNYGGIDFLGSYAIV